MSIYAVLCSAADAIQAHGRTARMEDVQTYVQRR